MDWAPRLEGSRLDNDSPEMRGRSSQLVLKRFLLFFVTLEKVIFLSAKRSVSRFWLRSVSFACGWEASMMHGETSTFGNLFLWPWIMQNKEEGQ